MFSHNLVAFLNFLAYTTFSITALALFIKVFAWITPHDDIQKVREGDVPNAVTLGGVCIGFTIPLLVCSYLGASLVSFVELALIIAVAQILLEKVLDAYLREDNLAVAILHACLSICLGLIVGFSIIP